VTNPKNKDWDPYSVACQVGEQRTNQIAGKILWIQDSGRSRRIRRWELLNPSELPIKPLNNRVCCILRKDFGITDVTQISEDLLDSLKPKLKEMGYSDYSQIWAEIAATRDSLTSWMKVCRLGRGKRLNLNQLASTVQKALHRRHQKITDETGATISTEAFIADLDLDINDLEESNDEIFIR
jgi:hypothetical protein